MRKKEEKIGKRIRIESTKRRKNEDRNEKK